MANVVVVVLEDPDIAPALLREWIRSGATGATIINSTGVSKFLRPLRDDVPLLPSLRNIEAGHEDLLSRTVFSVVADDATLDRVIAASEKIMGDLTKPGVGLLFVMPVSRAIGLRDHGPG